MKILEMNERERPRERLLDKGAQALSDGELLAILLRSGRRGESALDMARRLLSVAGGRLSGLFECEPEKLASLPGVGLSKAATLLAAFELGRRFMLEDAANDAPVTGPEAVYNLMRPRMKGLRHEECWEVLLDRRNRIIKTMMLTKGGGRSTVIDIPALIRNALEKSAAGIILVHNHPMGDPRPSRADIKETAALRDACASCSIALLDHIIVADDHFYSFNEEKTY